MQPDWGSDHRYIDEIKVSAYFYWTHILIIAYGLIILPHFTSHHFSDELDIFKNQVWGLFRPSSIRPCLAAWVQVAF